MSYTLGQAAKATGVSKMTLSRAIKKGTISATKNVSGGYVIDPSELHRVFPPVTSLQPQDATIVTEKDTVDTGLLHRLKELEIRLEVTQEQLKETKEERDEWRTQAQRLALTHQKPVEVPLPPPVTSVAKNQIRLSSGQIFAVIVGILLVALLVLLWPEIMTRLNGSAGR